MLGIVNAYVAQEGNYPYNGPACIGKGYTDWDGNGSLDCWIYGGSYNPQSALDSELQKVATIPKVETSPIKGNSGTLMRGNVYLPNQTVDGTTGRVILLVILEGINQTCKVPGVVSIVSGGYASNGADSTYANYNGVTLCYLAVNEP